MTLEVSLSALFRSAEMGGTERSRCFNARVTVHQFLHVSPMQPGTQTLNMFYTIHTLCIHTVHSTHVVLVPHQSRPVR